MHPWIDAAVEFVVAGSHWKAKVLLIILSIAALRTWPSYAALATPFVDRTWHDAQVKVDHPFCDTSRMFPPASHESNLLPCSEFSPSPEPCCSIFCWVPHTTPATAAGLRRSSV